MDENVKTSLETLTEIKHLMERSSRFISLSGLSGVFAGVYALIGAYAAYIYMNSTGLRSGAIYSTKTDSFSGYTFFFVDATLVLVFAIGTGIFFTTRKARRDGNSIFDVTARKLLVNLCIPLFAGGVFSLALILRGSIIYIAPVMLIFYGLSLINASRYTLNTIRILGLVEVGLGLISSFILGYGLIFWAIGFGVLHIVYGTYMYFKYEK
jgi:hypothetical protein